MFKYESRFGAAGVRCPLSLLQLSPSNHEEAAKRIFWPETHRSLWPAVTHHTYWKQSEPDRSLRTEAGPLAEGMEVDEFMKDRWREDCSWKVSIQEISPLPGHPQLAHCSPQNKVFSPSLCRSRRCVRASIRNNKQYCRINGKPLQNI